MSNPIRVATAALSGRIFAGRPTKDGMGRQADIVSDGKVVCTIKIVPPDAMMEARK